MKFCCLFAAVERGRSAIRMWLLLLLVCPRAAYGYPHGAPDSTCSDMMPQHGSSAQTSRPPYAITVSQTQYANDDSVTVTISGDVIKGYLIQARRTNLLLNTAEVVGSFAVASRSKAACVNAATGWGGQTHSREMEVTSLKLTWKAPTLAQGPQGNIRFRLTIVQDYRVYWLMNSIEITGSNPLVTTIAAPAGGSTLATAMPPVYLGDCGVTKSCYMSPTTCGTSLCSYVASWKTLDAFRVRFELQSLGGAAYIAIGFSPNGAMARTSLVACKITSGGAVVAEQSYCNGYSVSSIGQTVIGNVSGVYEGSRLTCSFTWNNDPALRSSSQIYDLQTAYYIVLAKGPVSGNFIQQHSEYPIISASAIAIFGSQRTINGLTVTGVPPNLLTTTVGLPAAGGASAATGFISASAASGPPTTLSPYHFVSLQECGVTKSCYSSPTACASSACNYVLTWSMVASSLVRLELQAAGVNYISLGVTKSPGMVDVSIVACVLDSSVGTASVQQLYSPDYVSPRQTISTNLFNVSAYVIGGSFMCTAVWNNSLALQYPSELFDLRTDYYVTIAKGITSGSRILKHTEKPWTSATTLVLLSDQLSVNGILVTAAGSSPRPLSTVPGAADRSSLAASQVGSSGSFTHPSGCMGTACTYELSWRKPGLTATALNMDLQTCGFSYVAVGFSKNPSMINASIIACIGDSSSNSVNVQQMYSPDYVTPTLIRAGNVKDVGVSLANGCLHCIFTWDNTPSARLSSQLYDLTEPHYLLFARGPANGGTIMKHIDAPVVSPVQYTLMAVAGNPAPTADSGPVTSAGAHGMGVLNSANHVPPAWRTEWAVTMLCSAFYLQL